MAAQTARPTPRLVGDEVSGSMSKDACRLSGRLPRPSFVFRFQGASMSLLVSSSIDLGSRLRYESISPAATAVIVAYTGSGSNCALGNASFE
jgi:hypothetical protein